ncbi:MAG: ATP-binding protein [Acidobacteria bacterium]|nr:ATP-binding protein [Acidobacteriota bacterium]MCL5287974.1 ATP-binding protein [Acidobacteriota bacterium]
MDETPQIPRADTPSSDSAADWLREAAEYLVHPQQQLTPPPQPELMPAYDTVLACRQQLEASQHELIQDVEMQAMQTVGSILAHDLHNLSLRLALLSQNLEQFYGDPEFLQSAKRVLDDTVERMQGLVDGFRARQETVIVKILTDVGDVLRAVVRQAGVESIPGLQVKGEYAESVNKIWADPFFLANAIRVLLDNAVQAMPHGGRLTLRTRSTAQGGAELEIEDSGEGMTKEFVERELFAPFRSSKGRGLGLGMYICQHIIRLHGGEIRLASEPGTGTLFRLTFPQGAEQS